MNRLKSLIITTILFIYFFGCQQKPDLIQTSKGTFSVPGTAYIDGRDPDAVPPLTIYQINIWEDVRRSRIRCKIFHGEEVKLLDYKKLDRYYFEVQQGTCIGWIPEHFLSLNKQKRIGDFVR